MADLIQNWRNLPVTKRSIMANQMQPASQLPTGFSGGLQGYTRQVQGNELASTHMADLGRNDNRVLQQARMRGAQAGASRGGMNSNLAAAGGESAWLDAAGNVAMQQAGAYGNAATQNLESLRQQRISDEGNQAQLGAAGLAFESSVYGSDRDFEASRERNALEREMTTTGREWQSGESERDRGFRSNESQRDRDFTTGRDATQQGYTQQNMDRGYQYQQEGQDRELNRQINAEIFRSMLDNPEEWDEYTASGASDFFERFLNPGTRQAQPPTQTTQPVRPPGT